MTNIFRWDNDERYQHYWGVRFQAHGISRTFSDGKYGCKERALIAAISWRDKMRKRHPPNYSGTPHDKGHYKNTQGITFRHNEKSGEMRWMAFWDERKDGKRYQRWKSFSVHKYGSLKARKLAIAYRQKMLKKIENNC